MDKTNTRAKKKKLKFKEMKNKIKNTYLSIQKHIFVLMATPLKISEFFTLP